MPESAARLREAASAWVTDWAALYAPQLAELAREPRPRPSLFKSFFQGGFECSTHRRAHDRQRLDVIAATGHDAQAAADYRLLARHGIRTVRDGLRWHLIGAAPDRYDWASLDPMLHAAGETGTEVIWDLLHYGWPDRLDIWDTDFPARFADFAAAATERIAAATPGTRFYAPVNEISFFAWGGGDVEYINPFGRGRGNELKRQLARTANAAMRAIRAQDPQARFVHPDPLINIIPNPSDSARIHAEISGYNAAQYDGWEMISGRRLPELGGRAEYLDIVGANYYSGNQWVDHGDRLTQDDPRAKPLRYLLIDAYARLRRPMFIAETGIEAEERPAWLAFICDEVRAAMRAGVPIEGICLYPVLNHPGWDNDRNCPNGLLEFHDATTPRTVYQPLAAELERQRALFAAEFGIAAVI